MEQIRQYVTRRRRHDLEQLEYPDCYDEYIGREPTGKIAKTLSPLVYVDIQSTHKESDPIVVEKHKEIIVEKRKRTHIEVIHSCGTSIVECDYEYNKEDYINYLNTMYWNGFAIEIRDIE